MVPHRRAPGHSVLQHAFEEMRFGGARTLNLRPSLPSPSEAAQRVEIWLRQHQVQHSAELLIVTGRGNNSASGISLVRETTLRVLRELRRKGVIASFSEHNPGAFVVIPAPLTALFDVAKRRRELAPVPLPASPPTLAGLDEDTRRQLRALAERSLDLLGIVARDAFVEGEMLRLFGALAATIGTGEHRERTLRQAIETAMHECD